MSRHLIFDTSTLVSAALRVGSIPHRALAEAFRSWDLCVSADTLLKLKRVLKREKFNRYINLAQRRAFAGLIRRNARVFVVDEAHKNAVRPPCRDPLDDKFLALALAADAEVIVSSDEDLLVLGPWRGIPIVTAPGFLSSRPK